MSMTQTAVLEQPQVQPITQTQDQSQEQQQGLPQEPKVEFVEQRKHPRYAFTATIEAIEQRSQTRIKGRTSDLSLGGCYVDTISPFSQGTIIHLRISKGNVAFKTKARVAYSLNGMGMGLSFVSDVPDSLLPVEKWIAEINNEVPIEFEEEGQLDATGEKENSVDEKIFVLNELVIELMRKGVLAEDAGKAMLRKLHN